MWRFYHKTNNKLCRPTIYSTLVLTFTFHLVTHQLEAVVAAATEGSVEIGAVVLTATIVSQTLVHVWKIKVRRNVAIASLLLSTLITYGCCLRISMYLVDYEIYMLDTRTRK